MTDVESTDTRLRTLFAEPASAPDEAFVARVMLAAAAADSDAARRRAAWRRFVVESVASAAIVLAFCLVWQLSPADLPIEQLPAAPAGAAMLAILMWFGLELRPSAVR